MRLFIRIILIVLLIVFSTMSVWHFSLQVFLADAHFRKVIQYKNGKSWPEMLYHYGQVLSYQPYESFYQTNFATDLKDGLDFYDNPEAKIQIIDLAIEAMNKIPQKNIDLRIMKNLAQIYTTKAGLTKNLEDFLIADEIFREVTNISPRMASIYKNWCQLKIDQEDWSRALEICRQAFYLYPQINSRTLLLHQNMIKSEMSEVYEKLGHIYFNIENWDKSEQMYVQALKLVPLGRPNIWKKIADIYYKQGDIDMAIEKNLHGMILSPQDSTWPLAIGLLYEEKGETIEAQRYFQKVLDLDPDNKTAQQFLGSDPIFRATQTGF